MYIMLPTQMKRESKSNANRFMELNMSEDTEIMIPLNNFQNYQRKKLKRFRSAFTTEQINYLEKEFLRFPYIGSANRKEVANVLNISEKAVKIWFQNRRMREKKETGNKDFFGNQNNINIEFANEQLNNVRDLQPQNVQPGSNNKSSQIGKDNCSKKLNIERRKESREQTIETCLSSQSETKINNKVNTLKSDSKCESILFQKDRSNVNQFTNLKTKVENESKSVLAQEQSEGHAFVHYNNIEKGCKKVSKDTMRLNRPQIFEMPQDLSSKSRLLDKSCLQNQYVPAFNSDQKYVSGYTHNYCTTPLAPVPLVSSVQPGNVIWKPVNMTTPPGLAPIPMTHSHMFPVNRNIPKGNCKCNCNCHGPSTALHSIRGFNQDARSQPQYIIAIPISNNACNKM